MNKTEFYNGILNALREGIKEVEKEQDKIAYTISRRKKQINSKMFSAEYVESELRPEIKRLRKESAELETKLVDKICTMCNSYITELNADDDLKPNSLTDDIKLLQTGITLTERDMKAMLKRNADNRTMSQILLRYAEEHNIETGMAYEGNKPLIESVEALAGTIPTVVKWHNRPDVFDNLLGESSEIASAFGGDE